MAGVLKFGEVEIRTQERLLTLSGQSVSMGSRAFDLLLALVDRSDRVVSRNELLDLVWPGLVVEDGNLAVQVSSLRKLLGANAIATIPGRGYRFTLPPEAGGASASASEKIQTNTLTTQSQPLDLPPLFGRDDDLAVLSNLLQTHRLVTVLGAGGIGKTSLAMAAARSAPQLFHHGSAWVELAPISDPNLLASAVAQALRLASPPSQDPVGGLVRAMQGLELLLVIDNAEHLVDAVTALVQAVLVGAPGVRLLVTSQVALKVNQERLLRLGPLSVPPSGASLSESLNFGAVALFVDQAKAADQRFELTADNLGAVCRLCAQMDGLALALKLAAARVPFLGLHGLEARLGERLKLLRGGNGNTPARQQTLMAALDWSHGLLTAPEQTVFRRLAVFVGGFTLELACAVASDEAAALGLDDVEVVDHLCSLVDRSLIAVDAGSLPRYRLLESTREYAAVQLAQSGEEAAIRHRHVQALTALFERADDELWVMHDAPWLATYTPELENARAAVDWAVQQHNPIAVGLMASLARLLFQLPLGHETRLRSDAVLPMVGLVTSPSIQARYWVRRSHAQWGVDQGLALASAQKAADLYRPLGDQFGLHESLYAMATSWRLPADQMAQILSELRQLSRPGGWPARVRADRNVAQVLGYYTLGAYEDMYREACEGVLNAQEADSKLRVNILRWYVCTALRGLGRLDEALAIGRESIQQVGQWRGWSVGYVQGEYVWCCLAKGQLSQAHQSLVEFFALSRSAGWTAFGYHSPLYARMALLQGQYQLAARLLGFADQSWHRIGTPFPDVAQERAEIYRALTTLLDAPVLDGLLAAGGLLDEEAVCSLTLSLGAPQ